LNSSPPLISVLVPAYNQEIFIVECLESILSQETAFSFEVILSIDESNGDKTYELCKKLEIQHPRLTVLKNPSDNVIYFNNRRLGRGNFLNAYARATGKYIALCDGDDVWIDPLKLQKQVKVLEDDEGLTVSFHNSLFGTKLESAVLKSDRQSGRVILSDAFYDILGQTSTMVFRRACGLPMHMFPKAPAGDWLLKLHFLKLGDGYYHEEAMGYYRFHRHAMFSSVKTPDKYLRNLSTYSAYKEEYVRTREELEIFKRAYRKFYIKLLLLANSRRDFRLWLQAVLQSFKVDGVLGIALIGLHMLGIKKLEHPESM
jgi:glycosyltransferase involved in cell wall biosynthesis